MNAKMILDKLACREPLFTDFPYTRHVRIQGTETEFGVPSLPDSEGKPQAIFDRHDLPLVFENGGEVYVDQHHLEYCTPEVGNSVSLVAYYKAGQTICLEGGFTKELWCNNHSWVDNVSFGAHESYFTSASSCTWGGLVPFLVARTLIDGSGLYLENGEFCLSQRADRIIECVGSDTMSRRPILCVRSTVHPSFPCSDSLADVEGWSRLHLICGDAHMCEVALFLKTSMTALVVELMEIGALPCIAYMHKCAVTDLHRVNKTIGDWYLAGIRSGPKDAIEVLSRYTERIAQEFGGRDEITDTTVIIMKDTLEKLAKNPMQLVGRLDWVTKLDLFNHYLGAEPSVSRQTLQSIDLEYHNVSPNPECSLYSFLKKKGAVERVVTDQMIRRATREAPADTRASIRGFAVGVCGGDEGYICVVPRDWYKLRIATRSSINQAKRFSDLGLPMPSPINLGDEQILFGVDIPDPRRDYAEFESEISALIN